LIVLQENLLQMIFNPKPIPKGRTKRCNKYCIDCGARLTYYGALSNPKAVNEYRVLTYGCPDCTKDWEKPHLIRVQRSEVFDTMKVVELDIKHEKGTALGKPSSPARRKKLEEKRKEEDLQNSHQW
jgi:hypothetical protein